MLPFISNSKSLLVYWPNNLNYPPLSLYGQSERGVTESILSSVNKALFRKLIRNFQLQNFIPCLFSKFHPMIFKSVPINFKYVPINFKHVPISYQFNHSVKTV